MTGISYHKKYACKKTGTFISIHLTSIDDVVNRRNKFLVVELLMLAKVLLLPVNVICLPANLALVASE